MQQMNIADVPQVGRHRDKMLAFAGSLTVLFLSSTNHTVIGPALPRIISELEGFELYAWAFTAFSLSVTVSLPIFGKLSDTFGRRSTTLAGIVLFALSSALTGLAASMPQLIAFRALQGLGGGALLSMSWALLGDIFTARERSTYQAANGAVFAASSLVGPLIGGVVTDSYGWRWIFYLSLPVAGCAYHLVHRYIPSKPRHLSVRVDAIGPMLLAGAILPLLIALTWLGQVERVETPRIIGMLLLAAATLSVFVLRERRTAHPMFDSAFLHSHTLAVGGIAAACTAVGMFGAIVFMPLYVQGVLGASASTSGLVLVPLMIGMIISSVGAGLVVKRTGRYRVCLLVAIPVMIAALGMASTLGTSTPIWVAGTYMAALGIGIGPTNTLFVLASQNAYPANQLGVVTGITMFFRQLGGTVGVAAFGAVVTAAVAMPPSLGQEHSPIPVPSAVLEAMRSPNLLANPVAVAEVRTQVENHVEPAVFEGILAEMRALVSIGISRTFIISAGFASVALVLTLFLPQLALRDKAES